MKIPTLVKVGLWVAAGATILGFHKKKPRNVPNVPPYDYRGFDVYVWRSDAGYQFAAQQSGFALMRFSMQQGGYDTSEQATAAAQSAIDDFVTQHGG